MTSISSLHFSQKTKNCQNYQRVRVKNALKIICCLSFISGRWPESKIITFRCITEEAVSYFVAVNYSRVHFIDSFFLKAKQFLKFLCRALISFNCYACQSFNWAMLQIATHLFFHQTKLVSFMPIKSSPNDLQVDDEGKRANIKHFRFQYRVGGRRHSMWCAFFHRKKQREKHITSFTFYGLWLCAQQAIEWNGRKRETSTVNEEAAKNGENVFFRWSDKCFCARAFVQIILGFCFLFNAILGNVDGYQSSPLMEMGWREV